MAILPVTSIIVYYQNAYSKDAVEENPFLRLYLIATRKLLILPKFLCILLTCTGKPNNQVFYLNLWENWIYNQLYFETFSLSAIHVCLDQS